MFNRFSMFDRNEVRGAYAGDRSPDSIAAEQQRFMVRVYNWMSAGLGLTGLVAWIVASPILKAAVSAPPPFP